MVIKTQIFIFEDSFYQIKANVIYISKPIEIFFHFIFISILLLVHFYENIL